MQWREALPLDAALPEISGIAQPTLQIIGSRDDYNATLATLEKICWALDVPLHDLLEMIDDPPRPGRKPMARKRPKH